MYQTFQEPEDPGPGQVVKKENDREHKVFKVKNWIYWYILPQTVDMNDSKNIM